MNWKIIIGMVMVAVATLTAGVYIGQEGLPITGEPSMNPQEYIEQLPEQESEEAQEVQDELVNISNQLDDLESEIAGDTCPAEGEMFAGTCWKKTPEQACEEEGGNFQTQNEEVKDVGTQWTCTSNGQEIVINAVKYN